MIETFDNYLNKTEINNFYDCLKHPSIPWFIGPDHSNSTIKNKSFVKGFVGKEIDFLINDFTPARDLYKKLNHLGPLVKIHFNLVKPGDKFDFHTDAKGMSVLVYLNPVWKTWWGSGTQFRNPNKVVKPKPGRAIFFNGQIEHRSIAPNLLMNDFGRLSVVYQFGKN